MTLDYNCYDGHNNLLNNYYYHNLYLIFDINIFQNNEKKLTFCKLIKAITSSRHIILRLINISFCW